MNEEESLQYLAFEVPILDSLSLSFSLPPIFTLSLFSPHSTSLIPPLTIISLSLQRRLTKIAEAGVKKKVRVLVDAEQTYLQVDVDTCVVCVKVCVCTYTSTLACV